MGQESDHIVLGDGLDLVNTRHIKGRILGLPNRLRIGFGDRAIGGHGITGMGFDLEPDVKTAFGRPDGHHFGAGVARDHGAAFRCRHSPHNRQGGGVQDRGPWWRGLSPKGAGRRGIWLGFQSLCP